MVRDLAVEETAMEEKSILQPWRWRGSKVWSVECGVWSVEECGERDGDGIFI
jgi:hypothetical protein